MRDESFSLKKNTKHLLCAKHSGYKYEEDIVLAIYQVVYYSVMKGQINKRRLY